MKRIAVLANQSSGKESAAVQTLLARSELWGRKVEFYFPSSILDLRSICVGLNPAQYEALVLIGGDGTLNQVVRSFQTLPNRVPIYPFPGGTANDLAKELGIRADWNQVQTLLDQKKPELIDLIEVNGKPLATVGGVGIGSILTEEFNRRRCQSLVFKSLSQVLHFQMYTLLSAKTILFRKDYIHRLHIQAPGFDERIRTPAVFFCNQAFLGGNMKVAPTLDNSDRRFNVLIVTECNRARLLHSMSRLKSGQLPSHFHVFSTDQLSLTDLDHRTIHAFGDGEPLTESPHLRIGILPQSLKVYRGQKESVA